MTDATKPNNPSSDYEAMCAFWDKVDTILGGTDAMRMAGEKYLPKFTMETSTDYEFRRKNAKFTNVFRDIVENLAAKPFTEELTLADGASERVKTLAMDIDSKGNNIHVFAQSTFFSGIADTITWILVDYTKGVPQQATIQQEKQLGARPYWIHIPAKRLLAIYSDIVNGEETFIHARIQEDVVERDGYGETAHKRVRVFNRAPMEGGGYAPATWHLFEEQKVEGKAELQWVEIESGDVTIGEIPLVPFITGRRKGSAWQFVPSMQDAADLQIELYQQESGLKFAKESTAFPMLAGNGVAPQEDPAGNPRPLGVGPKAVLYAPPQGQGGTPGNWEIIEPAATSLKFLADDIKETIQQLRELGRQPLTAQTGNLTVVTTAFAAQKGNSAIQAWALNLKDALEQALVLTAQWLKESKAAGVKIDTDFDVGLNDEKGPDTLIKMRAARDLSQRSLWEEMRRRGTLRPDFNPEEEEEALALEVPEEPNEADTETTPAANAA